MGNVSLGGDWQTGGCAVVILAAAAAPLIAALGWLVDRVVTA